MKAKKKKKTKSIQVLILFMIGLTGIYLFTSTYVKSYNISLSVRNQVLESKNEVLKTKIADLKEEQAELNQKLSKESLSSKNSDFHDNPDNIVVIN